MDADTRKVDFSALEKELPPFVFRNWPRWRDIIPYSPRTLANEDSLGTGPKEKIICGRVVGYPRTALIQWLLDRSRVIESKQGLAPLRHRRPSNNRSEE